MEEQDYLIWKNTPWGDVPIEVKKRIAASRRRNSIKTQGTLAFVSGFSFDSDSTVKLYQ